MTSTLPNTTGEPDLAAVIQTYNEVTERLKVSHELLRREVCRLREQVNEKNKELQRRERLAALGEMAAGVAHEIRNPLGGIGLYASLLERDLADRPEQQEIAMRISSGVRNVDSIIGGILAFAGGAEPNRQRARLDEILDETLTQAARRAWELDAQIDVDPALREVELFCDVGQMERALLNLILNALDAAGTGGHVWLRPGGRQDREGLFPVVVEDDGPGIAPQFLQRVFNPFFTTKDTGTGLGLAIVHRIAEAHAGRVTARNREGGGAAFVLSIPAARREVDTDQAGGNQ
jgi:signal transduction histidine kinase